jgi:hypothetical protein
MKYDLTWPTRKNEKKSKFIFIRIVNSNYCTVVLIFCFLCSSYTIIICLENCLIRYQDIMHMQNFIWIFLDFKIVFFRFSKIDFTSTMFRCVFIFADLFFFNRSDNRQYRMVKFQINCVDFTQITKINSFSTIYLPLVLFWRGGYTRDCFVRVEGVSSNHSAACNFGFFFPLLWQVGPIVVRNNKVTCAKNKSVGVF